MAEDESKEFNQPLVEEEGGQLSIFTPQYDLYPTDLTNVSNIIINSIGKIPYISEKLLFYSLGEIKERKPEDYVSPKDQLIYEKIKDSVGTDMRDGLIAEFSVAEFRAATGRSRSGSFYQKLDELLNTLQFTQQWGILYEDKGMVATTMVVTGSAYDKTTKKIYLKFNPDLKDRILNPENNYTQLSRKIMLNFKSKYSFATYRILKSKLNFAEAVSRRRGEPVRKEYRFEYDINEFKFLIKAFQVDTSGNTSEAHDVMRALKKQDFDVAALRIEKALDDEKERQRKYLEENGKEMPDDKRRDDVESSFQKFSDFKRDGLVVAFEEINGFAAKDSYSTSDKSEYDEMCSSIHKTDIHFCYDFVRKGTGAKVTTIIFYVRHDVVNEEKEEPVDEEVPVVNEDELIDGFNEIVEEKIKIADVRAIIKESGFKLEKIKKNYEYIKKHYAGKSVNLVALLIAGGRLTNGYEESETVVIGGDKNRQTQTKGAAKYNNYMSHEYDKSDMIELEKRLLGIQDGE